MADDLSLASTADLERRAQNSFFGKYRAIVTDNADPLKRGRLKLRVPSVLPDAETDWTGGAFPFGGNSGEAMIFVPAVGAHVLVEFIEGDRSSPVWTAAYYPRDAAAGSAGAPPASFDKPGGELQLIRSEKGIEIRIEDDRKDNQVIVILHPKGTRIEIGAKGAVSITDSANGEFLLDPDKGIARLKGHKGGELAMDDKGVTLRHGATKLELTSAGATMSGGLLKLDGDSVALGKGASAPLVNGTELVKAFASHLHPTGAGPSGPPPVPIVNVLLTKVIGA